MTTASATTITAVEAKGGEDRFSRYKDIITPEKLRAARVAVIGVGAIGRQVAIQLASMGVGEILMIDPDTVDEVNLGPQGFFPEDVGKPKTDVMAELLARISGYDNETVYNGLQSRYRLDIPLFQVVFCCVDNMEARKFIYQGFGMQDAEDKEPESWAEGKVFIEARMTAEVCEVRSVVDKASAESWLKAWFPQTEAHQDGCTSKSTIYCASMAAAIMVAQWTKAVRGIRPEPTIAMNLLAMTLDHG